jgi:hypothetical protein
MLQVGLEYTISVFERAKTFYALEGAAAVIGYLRRYIYKILTVLYFVEMQARIG